MRREKPWTAGVVTALAVAAIGTLSGARDANAQQQPTNECSNATLRGSYGIQIQGTRPAPGGATESVIGVVIRHYAGDGTFTQIGNVKGSITGLTPNAFASGIVQVNGDCTATVIVSAGGLNIEDRLVIVDSGRTLLGVTTQPAPVMITGIHKKIDVD